MSGTIALPAPRRLTLGGFAGKLRGAIRALVVGFHTVNLANAWLNVLGGTTFTGLAGSFIKLHTGDPGSAGTAAASANTTRPSATWAAASGGSKAISNTPSWASWAAGTETISHIGKWDNATAGSFYFSAALTTPRVVNNGDTLTLSSLSVSLAPLAA